MAAQDWDCYSGAFSPGAVIACFDAHFIRKTLAACIGDADRALSTEDRSAVLGQRARIRAIKSLRPWFKLLA